MAQALVPAVSALMPTLLSEEETMSRYLLCILALATPAGAQPLPALVEEALRNNREILAAQKRYEAARQRPSQASSLPDPTVSVGYTSNGGPWPVAGIGHEATSNAGVTVSQEMPFPGKRKLRGEIAAKEADAEFEQYLAVRLNVVSRLKQAYHELHHATVGIAFVKRYQELLRNILRISEARYTVGRAAQQDVFKAQTQFAIFETQPLRYQQERDSKEIEINALLNRPGAGRIEVPEDMAPGELTATLEDMLAHARTHAPALAREQKMVERSELAASLARKRYYPDYTVSGGYFNQGGMPPMWQFRVDFKLPAWLGKTARGGRRAGLHGQPGAARLRSRGRWHPGEHPRRVHAGGDGAEAGGPVPEIGDPGGATGLGIVHGRLPDGRAGFSFGCFRIS